MGAAMLSAHFRVGHQASSHSQPVKVNATVCCRDSEGVLGMNDETVMAGGKVSRPCGGKRAAGD
ncbi:hypothetical protein EYF80_017764 [Liparis tanakae]|uniref:Uncharacterized protein n=1 Tax=Liparis tanakae TaxID=230148 RepID=A0A4Z2I1N3_9TELE|nr:hypothetical protein EYF80_017764 [Liparis tanakae]